MAEIMRSSKYSTNFLGHNKLFNFSTSSILGGYDAEEVKSMNPFKVYLLPKPLPGATAETSHFMGSFQPLCRVLDLFQEWNREIREIAVRFTGERI